MKRARDLMPKIYDIDNLLLAYYKARRGKLDDTSVKYYTSELYSNILKLHNDIKNLTIDIGRYHYFKIFDPKERLICAAAFEERIIHHAIINVCKPYFERYSIYDSYATREGKGVYAAIERAKIGIKRYQFVAKLDVRKYFDSISHVVLKDKLTRLFKDKELLSLLYKIIDSYNTVPGRGIPIGNLTSQYFANYYLGSLDHFVKENLKVPMYVRYMDDMLVFAQNKVALKTYLNEINAYLNKILFLSLKPPQLLMTESMGITFLGYTIFKNKILLNKRSKIRFKTKYKYFSKQYDLSEITQESYLMHINPLLAFVKYAYTKNMRKNLIYNS